MRMWIWRRDVLCRLLGIYAIDRLRLRFRRRGLRGRVLGAGYWVWVSGGLREGGREGRTDFGGAGYDAGEYHAGVDGVELGAWV